MGRKESAATVVGGMLFVVGISLSASFLDTRVGGGTVAQMVFGEYSTAVGVGGILAGIVLTLFGIGIGVGIGNMERY